MVASCHHGEALVHLKERTGWLCKRTSSFQGAKPWDCKRSGFAGKAIELQLGAQDTQRRAGSVPLDLGEGIKEERKGDISTLRK